MNLFLLTGILIGAGLVGAGLFWFVHHRSGSRDPFFTDSTRGAAVFGTTGTAFALVLSFVTLIGLQELSTASDGAQQEAVSTLEIYRDAQLLPDGENARLAGTMVCYARSVINLEWPAMRDDQRSPATERWVNEIGAAERALPVTTLKQQSAFNELLGDNDRRTDGRRARLGAASSPVPDPIWYVLLLFGAMPIGMVMLFRSRDEQFRIQALMVAGVTIIVVAGLSMVWYLAHPYGTDTGSLPPAEMQVSLRLMAPAAPTAPCDANGIPS